MGWVSEVCNRRSSGLLTWSADTGSWLRKGIGREGEAKGAQSLVVADPEEEGTKPGLSARSKLLSREGPEEGLSQKLINQDFP